MTKRRLVLRILWRSLLGACVLGPVLIVAVAFMYGGYHGERPDASNVISVLGAAIVVGAPTGFLSACLGAATAIAIADTKRRMWSPQRWWAAGVAVGAIVGPIAAAAVVVMTTHGHWLLALEDGPWGFGRFGFYALIGAAVGMSVAWMSATDLETLPGTRTAV